MPFLQSGLATGALRCLGNASVETDQFAIKDIIGDIKLVTYRENFTDDWLKRITVFLCLLIIFVHYSPTLDEGDET